MDDAKDDSLFLIIYFLSAKSCMPSPKATFKKIENNGSPEKGEISKDGNRYLGEIKASSGRFKKRKGRAFGSHYFPLEK